MTRVTDIRHLLGLLALSAASAVLAADRPSNVVVIMTDNHGAWTLGCYGNSDIHTLHIDRLASEGILFLQAYADKLLPSFPRQEPHPWLHNNRNYINNPTSIRRYAAELSAIDDGVGEVMQTLQQCGIDRETLVIFTADQRWVGGQGGFWGMGDHTRPLTAYDGILRIPLIFRQPGRIPADRRTDQMVSNYDLMPSLLNYLGLADANMPSPLSAQPNRSSEDGPRDSKSSSDARRAEHPISPGRDFSPVLSGETLAWENVVFYEFENTRAIRTDKWKLIARFPDGPDEL